MIVQVSLLRFARNDTKRGNSLTTQYFPEKKRFRKSNYWDMFIKNGKKTYFCRLF